MKRIGFALFTIAAIAGTANAQTYQGRLEENGRTFQGFVDLRFRVFSAPEDGTQVAFPQERFDVAVADGLFTIDLDFNVNTWNGEPRWLEIDVAPAGSGEFETLTPRQPVGETPYSLSTRGMHVDSDGTVVFGSNEEMPGDLCLSQVSPDLVLRSTSEHANASVRFESETRPGAALEWSQSAERLALFCFGNGGPGRLTVNGNGNVAIGQFGSADTRLHVNSGTDAGPGGGGYLQLGSSIADNLAFDNNEIMARTNGEVGTLFVNHNGGDVMFGGANNTTKVGIRTTDPGVFTLAVNGQAAKPGGGSWSSFSDARLKRNIKPLPTGTLDRLLSLRGYTYEFTEDAIRDRLALPGTQTGLLAQEVERVFPDWVEEDAEGYKYVTERGTTAIMIEALRELSAQNKTLSQELAAVKTELAALRGTTE